MITYFDTKKLQEFSYPLLYPSLFPTPVISSHHHAFICRQAIQDSPLDLSMSLVKSASPTVPSSNDVLRHKSLYFANNAQPLTLDLSKSSSYSSCSTIASTSPVASLSPSSVKSVDIDCKRSPSPTTIEEDDDDDEKEMRMITTPMLPTKVAVKGLKLLKTRAMIVENAINEKNNSNKDKFIMDDKQTSANAPLSASTNLTNNHLHHPHHHQILKKPRERTMLPCDYCGKAFDRPSLLRRHLRTHTGEKPHVCDVCGKGFSTSSSLNTHRRIHSGEKPHQCNVCGKRFTASSNLYYHRMTHNKEKPHKCTLCSKSFPTPGDLKSHMYVHNGSWPFKCQICNRGFSKQTNLRNHMYLHTGDRPHECEVCQKKFALACNLRAHLKTHEEHHQSERCQRCGREFPVGAGLLTLGACHDCYNNGQAIPLIRSK